MLDCPVSSLSEFATEYFVVAKLGEVVEQGTYSLWNDVCRDHHALSHAVAEVEHRGWQLLEEFGNAACVVVSVNVELVDLWEHHSIEWQRRHDVEPKRAAEAPRVSRLSIDHRTRSTAQTRS